MNGASEMDKRCRVIYFNNCWFTNVGEAFIDIGSLQLIKNILPNAVIACASDMTNYYYNSISKKNGEPFLFRSDNRKVIADFYENLECDYIILSGMFATSLFLNTQGRIMVDSFLKRGAKLIFLGLGGCTYEDKEVSDFSRYIESTKPVLVMTRDDITYNNYKDISNCISGIDCAFWADESFSPQGFGNGEYDVITFNRSSEPEGLDTGEVKIVRPWHMQYTLEIENCRKGFFVSDTPYDYLTLYANARRVFTDLVHATIVSLMYGVPVKYWYFDKRSSAFDALKIDNRDGWLKLDHNDLEIKRETIQERIVSELKMQ